MAHGTAAGMKGENTISAGPGVGKQRISACCPTTTMTGLASLGSGKIGSAPQYRMGCRGVLAMTIEVSGVARDAFSACRLAGGAANQRAIGGAMA